MDTPAAGPSRVADLCASARRCLYHLDGDGALARATEALQEDGTCALAYSLSGWGRRLQDDQAGAMADLDRAVALAPDDVEVRCFRALARWLQTPADESGAREDLQVASTGRPASAAAWGWRGYTRKVLQGESEGALADLDKAVRLAGPDATLSAMYHCWRGAVRIDRAEVSRGLADLDRAVELDPDNPAIYFDRAAVFEAREEYGRAVAELDEVVLLAPARMEPYRHRARLKQARGDLAGARADLDSAVRLQPDNGSLYPLRAQVREEQDDLLGALADWERAFQLNPQPGPLDHCHRARVRRKCLDLRGALAALDSAVRLHADCAQLFQERAEVKAELGDEAGAEADRAEARRLEERERQQQDEALARAIAANPTSPGPLVDRASALCSRHQSISEGAEQGGGEATHPLLAQALTDLDRALQLDPRYLRAYQLRAGTRMAVGNLGGALADLNELIRRGAPPPPRNYLRRARVRALLGQVNSAIADLREGIKRDTYHDVAELHGDLADLLRDKDDETGAVAAEADGMRVRMAPPWEGVLYGVDREIHGDLAFVLADYDRAGRPNVPEVAYYRHGLMRHLEGDLQDALEDHEEAIEANPQFAPAYRGRGVIRRERGDLAEAIIDLDQALLLRPAYPLALYQRGNARQANGDLTTALADYDRALELEPGMACAHLARGSVHEAGGNLAGALADYEETLTLYPGDMVAYHARGRVRLALGQLDQAVSDFDAALERDPAYINAFLARRAVRIQQEGAPLAHACPYLLGASLGGALLGLGLGWLADLAGSALRDADGTFPWLPAGGLAGALLWLLTVTLVFPLLGRLGLFADVPAVAWEVLPDPTGRPALFHWYRALPLIYGLGTLVLAWVFPFWVALLALYVLLLARVSLLYERNSVLPLSALDILLSVLLLVYLAWTLRGQSLGLLHAGLLGAVVGGLSGWVLGGVVGGLAGWLAPGRCGRSFLWYCLEREQVGWDSPGSGARLVPTLSQASTPAQLVWRAGAVVVGGTGLIVGFLAAVLAWDLTSSDPSVWTAGGTGLALLVVWLQGRRLVLRPRPKTSDGPGYAWARLSLASFFLAGVVGAGLGYLAWSLDQLLGGMGPGQAGWPVYWGLAGGGVGAVGGLRLWAMLR